MTVDLSQVNWLAVGAAALATFLLGGVWYTALFGKAWQRLNGYSEEKLAEMKALRPPPVFFATMLVCYAAAALAMALLAQGAGAGTFAAGATLGLVVWVVVAAVLATNLVASDKPWGAFAIDAAFALVHLPMSGAIVAAWGA